MVSIKSFFKLSCVSLPIKKLINGKHFLVKKKFGYFSDSFIIYITLQFILSLFSSPYFFIYNFIFSSCIYVLVFLSICIFLHTWNVKGYFDDEIFISIIKKNLFTILSFQVVLIWFYMIFCLISILLHICNVGEYFDDELNINFVVVKKKLKKILNP